MQLTALDKTLWAAGFLGHAVLLCVLLLRKRLRAFPVFTTLIAFDATLTITLFGSYIYGYQNLYAILYWSSLPVDFCLQIAVILEIAGIVLRPTGTWVRDARVSFLIWGLVGAFLAAGLAYAVQPSAATTLSAWEVRGNLFTSLLTCELFLAMMFASTRLGLAWRHHVMQLAQGLTVWAVAAVLVDTAHSILGTHRNFAILEHARMFVYLGTLCYWMVAFWLDEPERRPLSEEMRKYLVALHERVEYDLAKVSSARNTR